MRCMIPTVDLKAKDPLMNARILKGKYFIFSNPCASKP